MLIRLVYSNNKDAGTASVTAVNLSDDTDTISENFTITQRDIVANGSFPSSADLAQEIASSSTTVTPQITVTDSGNQDYTNLVGRMSDSAVPGVDFTYSFKNNKGPGTATVTITGRNNYTGTKEITFTISLLEGSKISFDFLNDMSKGMSYTGLGLEPEIADTVAYDGEKINKSDYEPLFSFNL